MTPESEVRFGPNLTSSPLFIWKACTPSFAPSLLKQLLFYTLPRVVLLSQSPLPALYGSTACYCPMRLCWNTVLKGGYITHTTQPSSTPFDPTGHDWNGGPSPRAIFVFVRALALVYETAVRSYNTAAYYPLPTIIGMCTSVI
jgi:hypothetical protein